MTARDDYPPGLSYLDGRAEPVYRIDAEQYDRALAEIDRLRAELAALYLELDIKDDQ